LRNNKNNKKGGSIVGVPSIWMLPGYPITAHHVYTFLLYWLAVWRHNEPNLALKTKKCPRSIVGVPLRRDLYGKPYDRAPLVCILNFSGGFAVWQLELLVQTNRQTGNRQTKELQARGAAPARRVMWPVTSPGQSADCQCHSAWSRSADLGFTGVTTVCLFKAVRVDIRARRSGSENWRAFR